MPEAKNYVFSHIEIAEILVKKLDIHEGLWGVYFEFGFGAANVPAPTDPKILMPATISIVQKIGIQRFDAANNLTVDAAHVNPKPASSARRASNK